MKVWIVPTYSFRCEKCGTLKDVVATMSEATGLRPRCCRKVMRREYQVPRLAPDSYGRAITKSFLNSMDGDVNKNAPPFESRSEEKRYRSAHQEKFGWGGYE